jgi:hypothetical protein
LEGAAKLGVARLTLAPFHTGVTRDYILRRNVESDEIWTWVPDNEDIDRSLTLVNLLGAFTLPWKIAIQ